MLIVICVVSYRHVAVVGTWDDHDYAGDNMGASYPNKEMSQQVFLDFLNEPESSPRRKQKVCWPCELYFQTFWIAPFSRTAGGVLVVHIGGDWTEGEGDTSRLSFVLRRDHIIRSGGAGRLGSNCSVIIQCDLTGENQWKWLEKYRFLLLYYSVNFFLRCSPKGNERGFPAHHFGIFDSSGQRGLVSG